MGVTSGGLAVRVIITMANEAQQLTGSVTVSLHPLVIMNVSDHFTRCRVQEGGGSVVGTKGAWLLRKIFVFSVRESRIVR